MFENIVKHVEDENCRKILEHLLGTITSKNNEINMLHQRVFELEKRISTQEKYTSKDCLIVENMPLTRSNEPLTKQVCQFLKDYLNYSTTPSNFKACHLLGPWTNENYPPAIIIKFIYFAEKDLVFSRKAMLAGKINHANKRSIFIKERLPEYQRQLKSYAEKRGLVTTTLNCNVKLFRKSTNGHYKSFAIESVEDIVNAETYSVKKSQDIGSQRPNEVRVQRRSEFPNSTEQNLGEVSIMSEDGDKLAETSDNSKHRHERSGNAVTNEMQMTLPVKSKHCSASRSVNTNKNLNSEEVVPVEDVESEVVPVKNVELEQGNDQQSKNEDISRSTKELFATPNSTKSLLKRLRDSPNDEEVNINMLNEFLQKAKNAKQIQEQVNGDEQLQEQVNGDENDKYKEVGEVSDKELSDGEIDSQVGS